MEWRLHDFDLQKHGQHIPRAAKIYRYAHIYIHVIDGETDTDVEVCPNLLVAGCFEAIAAHHDNCLLLILFLDVD